MVWKEQKWLVVPSLAWFLKKNLNLYFHAEGRDKNVSFPLELLSSTA